MTKRKTSKTKPYLQSGVDLWGRKHLIWPHDEKLCGPGQQKRSHVVSEKLMNVSIGMDKSFSHLGAFLTPLTPWGSEIRFFLGSS